MRAGYSLYMVTTDPSVATDILHNQHSHDKCWASLCKVVIDLHAQHTHRMLQYPRWVCHDLIFVYEASEHGVLWSSGDHGWHRGVMKVSQVMGRKFVTSSHSAAPSRRDSLDEKPGSNLFPGPHLGMFTVINGGVWVSPLSPVIWCLMSPMLVTLVRTRGPETRVSPFINYYPPVSPLPRSPGWPWPGLTKICKL